MNNMKTYEIDEIDLEILKILSIDGRKNKNTIATKLKRSPNTIIKHISNLEENGVIKNYGVQIDYEKLGYKIIALIEITVSKGKMLEVEQDIAKIPNVFAVYDITGEYDALILARFKNRTNTHIVLNIIKEISSFTELLKKRD